MMLYKDAIAPISDLISKKSKITVSKETTNIFGHVEGPLSVSVFNFKDPEDQQFWYYEVEDRFEESPGYTDPDSETWLKNDLLPFAAVGGEMLGDNNFGYLFFDLANAKDGNCPILFWDKDYMPEEGFKKVASNIHELGLQKV